jgi:hypothetical protein
MRNTPVKYPLLVSAVLLFCLSSCEKNYPSPCCGANIPDGSIFAKWNLVSDSTFAGAGLSNHPVIYDGKSGDYFDVRVNGIIYTKEGPVLDTLTYNLVSDTGMVVTDFGLILNGTPEISRFTFTAHSMIIKAPTLLTPGGEFGRKVTLSR